MEAVIRRFTLSLSLMLLPALAAAQSVTAVSAANFRQIAPDSIATVFAPAGSRFTTVTAEALSLPLPTEIGRVRVFIDGLSCGLFYVSSEQANFYVPAGVSPGLHLLQVFTPQGQTFSGQILVMQQQPGIFTLAGSGQGIAAASFYDYGAQYCISLYGTGFGANQGATLYLADGRSFQASYVGRAPGFAGLQQLNFLISERDFPHYRSGAFVRVWTEGGGFYDTQGFEIDYR